MSKTKPKQTHSHECTKSFIFTIKKDLEGLFQEFGPRKPFLVITIKKDLEGLFQEFEPRKPFLVHLI